jgi:hypothetical protein
MIKRSPMLPRCLTPLAFALSTVALSSSALAGPMLFHAQTQSLASASIGVTDYDNDAGEARHSVSSSATMVNAFGSAESWGTITDGVLRGYAEATAQGAGQSFLTWRDTLLISSTTLAAGTSVQLGVRIDFSRSMSCWNGTHADADVRDNAGVAVASVWERQCEVVNDDPLGVIDAVVGDTINVYADMNIGAGDVLEQSRRSVSDASHTFRFYLTPLDDFTFVTASGATYTAPDPEPPVPEPATLVLLGVGLLAARVQRRR